MISFWSITKNTFLQTIRQPIFGVMVFLTFALLVITLPLSGWTLGSDWMASDQRMLENLGLSTLLMMGMLTAVFSASAALSREIEEKTALTVISKPVLRATFVLGKFVGVALAVSLAYYLGSLVYMMTVRHHAMSAAWSPYDWPVIVLGITSVVLALAAGGAGNYLFGWTFTSATILSLAVLMTAAMGAIAFLGKGWTPVPITDTFGPENIRLPLLTGLYLMYLAVMLLTAVAVAAGTRLGQVLTLLVCFGVLVAGSMIDWLQEALADLLPGGEYLAGLLPALPLFYPLDWLSREWSMPASLVGMTSLYFACYLLAVLAVAMGLFQTRQLAATAGGTTLPGAVALVGGLGRIAAVLLGISAAVLLTQPSTYTLWGSVNLVAMLLLAVGLWWLCVAFSASRKWAWWTFTALSAVALAGGVLVLTAPFGTDYAQLGATTGRGMIACVAGGALLVAMLLPKTRHHFRSS